MEDRSFRRVRPGDLMAQRGLSANKIACALIFMMAPEHMLQSEIEYIDARLILSLRPTGPTGNADVMFGSHFWP